MADPEQAPRRNGAAKGPGRHHLGLVVALAVSGVCLYFFLRGTRWDEVGAAIAGTRLGWVVAAFLASWGSVVVRGLRWRILLAGLKRVSWVRLYHMWMIAIMVNGLLPARVGEFAKAWLLARKEGLPFVGTLATVVVERILDLALVVILALLVLVVYPFPAGQSVLLPGMDAPVEVRELIYRAGASFALVCGAAILGSLLVVFLPRQGERLIRTVVGRVSPRLALYLVGLLGGFRSGLTALGEPRRAIGSVVWTVLVWVCLVSSNGFMMPAFGIQTGVLGMILLTVGLALAVALPQAPGFLGVFHLGVTLVLVKCMGVDESVAKAAAIVLWCVQLVPLVLLGFVSLAAEGVSFGDVRRARGEGAPS